MLRVGLKTRLTPRHHAVTESLSNDSTDMKQGDSSGAGNKKLLRPPFSLRSFSTCFSN